MEIEGNTPKNAEAVKPDMKTVVFNQKAALQNQLTEVRAVLHEFHMREMTLVNQLSILEGLEQVHAKLNEKPAVPQAPDVQNR